MNKITEKYQKLYGSTGHYKQSANVEMLRLEVENLRNKMTCLDKMCKHVIGKDLDLLPFKKLQHLEKKSNLGARKIRSRKDKISLEHIGSLKEKQLSLEEENANLRKE
ncbi:hypothetical protein KI387_023464, partial [Taxus chinensis]